MFMAAAPQAGRNVCPTANWNMNMTRQLAFAFGLAALVAGRTLHGVSADRWQNSSALEGAAAVLPSVPEAIAGAAGEGQSSDAAEFSQAGAAGYWTRIYRKDGKEFLAILMVGRSGRMAVHTPEVCYRGAGFDIAAQPVYH